MEFKNGYNFMYQKAKEIYASKIGRPAEDDEAVDFGLTEEEKKNIKLVYEKKEGIIVNFTGLPTADDKPIELTAGGEVVVGPSGDVPSGGLFKFNVGDKFVDFHFDTTLTPNKDDFIWTEGDGFISVLGAYEWHQHGSDDDIDYDAIAAQYIPVGYVPDIPEEWGDILIIMNFNGCLIYTNNAEFAHMAFGGDYQEGWQVGSFRELIEKYEIDWDLSDKSFGKLLAQIPGELSYLPNYTQSANGKYYGFKKEDYKDEPGPTPPPATLTPFENGQTIKGFDFGSVANGQTKSDLDAFLLALEPGSEALMVSSDDYEQLLLCGRFEGRDGQPSAGIIADNATWTILYATDDCYDHDEKVCSKGFQNLTDGKYILPGDITFEVAHMNEGVEDTSWNGRLVGAVLGEPGPVPGPTLEEMEDGDELVNFHFNTSSVPTKDSFNLTYNEDGSAEAVLFGLDWEPNGGTYIYAGFFPQGYEFDDDYTLDQDCFGIFGQGLMPMLYADAGMAKLVNDMFGGEITIEPGWQGATLKGAAAIMNVDAFDEGHGIIRRISDGVSPEFVGFTDDDYYIE